MGLKASKFIYHSGLTTGGALIAAVVILAVWVAV
jgi:hypothetical protein